MRIQKTRASTASAAKEVLKLFENGMDVVIIQHPKGIVIEDGERCHVFISDHEWETFGDKLWHCSNWTKVTPIDQRFKHCLYSPHNYTQTVQKILDCFPDIEFREEPIPAAN